MTRLRAIAAVTCALASVVACSRRDAGEGAAPAGPTGAPAPGPAYHAMGPHDAAAPGGEVALHSAAPPGPPATVFSERGGGVADVVEKDGRFRVVHGGRPGKPYAVVRDVVLSPDGRRCAYAALVDGKWRVVVDGKEGAPFDTVRLPVFSRDGKHVAYQAMSGELWHLVVGSTLNAGTKTRYLNHEFSGDSTRIAFVDDVDDGERGRLVISDLGFRHQTVVETGVSSMVLDAAGSRLAAVAATGATGAQQRVVTVELDAPDRPQRGAAYDAVAGVVFGPDGASVAYVGERAGRRFVVLDDREVPVVAGHLVGPPVVIPGKKGVGVLLASLSGSVLVQEYFVAEKPRDASYELAEGLVYAADGRRRAYAARRGESWFVVLDGKEGPPFDRVVSPLFSADGRFLAYRARKGGMRFVVVASTRGDDIRLHPSHEQVFPVRFSADGSSIGYGTKDGSRAAWVVEEP